MIYKIQERIDVYFSSINRSIKAVVFGDSELPAPPYVVIKQEEDPGLRGTQFRIITHMKPGQQKALRKFVRVDLGQCLDDFDAVSESGVYNKLKSDPLSVGGTIITTNSDKTISLERLYYMGDRLY